MKIFKFIVPFLFVILVSGSKPAQNAGLSDYTQYVNTFIGTDGTGHTFPGPCMPFGMVQPGPDNVNKGWSYTSGYQYRDSVIIGFSQTRANGTGINEFGDVLLQPFTDRKTENFGETYDKASEKASPGYYTVTLNNKIKVELTCTERVALHQYTYPNLKAKLLVDLQHGLRFLTDSLVLESDVNVEDNKTISGYCHTKNWVERKYFFTIQFNQAFTSYQQLSQKNKEKAPRYVLAFNLKNKILQTKIALSTVSVAGAKNNLQKELPGWDFNATVAQAKNIWNSYLSRIDIEAPKKQKEIFYSSLYRFFIQPSNIADVDGKYRGADDKISVAPNKAYFSTLSNWDIYRGAFPLLQILAPEKINDIVNSMLIHHKAAGFLPIWSAWGQDNYCMIGNHAIPMILSAYQNGFTGFNANEALQAMVETSTKSHINSDWELYNQYGYYPFDKLDNEAVSRTLESGYDDWCVAEMAKKLGKNDVANTFSKRALYYQNLFDTETTFFRGRDTKGNWRTPFNPLMATSPMNNPGDYTEANAWQYFWTPAQHDVQGLMTLLGGKDNFTKKLNAFFSTEAENPNKFLGQEAMIGQYAHGNEPSHHISYLYAFTDEPKVGQKYIHRILNEFHNNTPNGMIGNDDCGQMSAWYIFATLGFYPLNAANGEFVFGSPQIKSASIRLSKGKYLKIAAENFSNSAIYNERRSLNGQRLKNSFITCKEILQGGVLKFYMQEK